MRPVTGSGRQIGSPTCTPIRTGSNSAACAARQKRTAAPAEAKASMNASPSVFTS